MDGTGVINLNRDNDLTGSQGGRLYQGSFSSGSQINPDFFGIFSDGSVKAVTISATTNSPTDVARVLVGTSVRTEVDLRGRSQSLTVGPGEQLAFVTQGRTTLKLVVNALSESEHAARFEEPRAFKTRVRLTSIGGAGFMPVGVVSPTLTWNETSRLLSGSISGGTIPLTIINPNESRFEGMRVRVRVAGFEAVPAAVGYADGVNNDVHFVTTNLGPSQWSPWFTVGHDDRIAIRSPPKRASASALAADIQAAPLDASSCCDVSVGAASSDSGESPTPPGGAIPFANFSGYPVNAAGAVLLPEGWEIWKFAIAGNPTAPTNHGFHDPAKDGNKVFLGTEDTLLDQPLSVLSSLEIRYANRAPGNDGLLGDPYINFIIDLNDGNNPSTTRIGVLDRTNNPSTNLLEKQSVVGGTIVPEDHEYNLVWVGGGRIKIVGAALAGVTPVVPGASWLDRVYTIADIMAAYPASTFVRRFPADNGMPAKLCMPPFLIVLGDSEDSGGPAYARALIRRVVLNG